MAANREEAYRLAAEALAPLVETPLTVEVTTSTVGTSGVQIEVRYDDNNFSLGAKELAALDRGETVWLSDHTAVHLQLDIEVEKLIGRIQRKLKAR